MISQHRALTVSRQASGISALSQWPSAGTLHSRPTPMREEHTRRKVGFMLKMREKRFNNGSATSNAVRG